MHLTDMLTNPQALFSRSEVLTTPSPVPKTPGIYAWYFRQIPTGVPCDRCVKQGDLTLLYVGISPRNGSSSQNLRKRITNHYRGNAEGSTLRRTLGVLLTAESQFPLRRVGSGKRMTFTHLGEQFLDDWMEKNAFVCWVEHPTPWLLEAEILKSLSLPLNIQDNARHPFASALSKKRSEAMQLARLEEIAQEENQRRRRGALAQQKGSFQA